MSQRSVPAHALPWVVVGIVLVALSLRGPIIAPTPVITQLQSDLGLSAATAGLLTGLPVLLFALATPLASKLIGRFGPEAAVLVCLSGVLAGTVVRSAGPAPVVLAGTVVIGAAIAVGNIVVPVIIRRDVPWRRPRPPGRVRPSGARSRPARRSGTPGRPPRARSVRSASRPAG